MEQNYYQIDKITIKEAATRAICRVADTYSPSFLVECAQNAGLALHEIPGESKYFGEILGDKNKQVPLEYIVRKNIWEKHVKIQIREPFKKYFLNLINNTKSDGIEQWGINCYNMFRKQDLQYD